MLLKNLSRLVFGIAGAFLFNACSIGDSVGSEDNRDQEKITSSISAWSVGNWALDPGPGRREVYGAAHYASGPKGYVVGGELFRIDGYDNGFYKITYNTLHGLEDGYVEPNGLGIYPEPCVWARPRLTLSVMDNPGSYRYIGTIFAKDVVCIFGYTASSPSWAHIQFQTGKSVVSGWVRRSSLYENI